MPSNTKSPRGAARKKTDRDKPQQRGEDVDAGNVWRVRAPSRQRSRHHAVMAAAFASALSPDPEYEGEDAPDFCGDGVAQGLPMSKAIRIFRALYPEYPASYLRDMTREDICRKMSYDAVNEMTTLVCANLMDANTDPERTAHLIAILSALEDKPPESYAGAPKRVLCEMLSTRLKPHQRFRFMRNLVPTRAMRAMSGLVRKAAGAVGDAAQLGQIVLSVPGVENVLGQAPAWLRGTMLGLGALRSVYQPGGALKTGFVATALPTMFRLAQTPVAPYLGEQVDRVLRSAPTTPAPERQNLYEHLYGYPDTGPSGPSGPTTAIPDQKSAYGNWYDSSKNELAGRVKELSARALNWGVQKATDASEYANRARDWAEQRWPDGVLASPTPVSE